MPTSLDVSRGIQALASDPLSAQAVIQALTDAGKAAVDAADAILAVQAVISDPAVAVVEIPGIARNIIGTYNNLADAVNILTGKETIPTLDPSSKPPRVHAPVVPPTPPANVCILPFAIESIITGAPSDYCFAVPEDISKTVSGAIDSLTTTSRDGLLSDLAAAAKDIEGALSKVHLPPVKYSLLKLF